ncbi:peroxiredoxin Q/BCP [Tremella mesenterica]|uniref:thioredoxin-dependent peroxiredoxin n=1 Tax=Tremella mesenterica TaxID=5217 RepID=A0A4V1M388_TREME|nr:peroxiredoxin Q/BCP [Tremella mesenterica]
MAPKSDAPPSSRRSARLAGSAPTQPEEGSKKRTADSTTKDAPAKKPKTTSTKSTNGKNKSAEEEKKAEAPKSAKSDTGPRGALKKGDKLPKMVLQDNTGGDVEVSKLAEEEGVVIFLYPKADTPGCTTQACGFRDSFDEINSLGYQVYGLSKDKPEAQQKWIKKKDLNFKLLCDPESKLIKRLGAFVQPNNTKRSHFIFEKGTGKLVDIAIGVKPADE